MLFLSITLPRLSPPSAGEHGKKVAVIENEYGEVRIACSCAAPATSTSRCCALPLLPTGSWVCNPPAALCMASAAKHGFSRRCAWLQLRPWRLPSVQVGVDDALVMDTKEEIFEMNNVSGGWRGTHPLGGWRVGFLRGAASAASHRACCSWPCRGRAGA